MCIVDKNRYVFRHTKFSSGEAFCESFERRIMYTDIKIGGDQPRGLVARVSEY